MSHLRHRLTFMSECTMSRLRHRLAFMSECTMSRLRQTAGVAFALVYGCRVCARVHDAKGLHQDWTQTSLYLQVIYLEVVILQVMFLEPIYIPWALNTGICIQQGDLFYSAGLHRNHVLATANAWKNRERFWKNAGEWTGRVEISKEEIPGGKLSMYGYMLTYSRL